MLHAAGKSVWIVIDGSFTKRPIVRPILAENVTLVGRLRKDSALRDLPPPVTKPGSRTAARVRRESPFAVASRRVVRADVFELARNCPSSSMAIGAA